MKFTDPPRRLASFVSLTALAISIVALALAMRFDARRADSPTTVIKNAQGATIELLPGEAAKFRELSLRLLAVDAMDPTTPNDDRAEFTYETENERGEWHAKSKRPAFQVDGFSLEFIEIAPTLDGESPAVVTVRRIARPTRRATLASGESIRFMGFDVQLGGFDPRDPDDRDDDAVRLHVTRAGESKVIMLSETDEQGMNAASIGELKIELLSATPDLSGSPQRGERVAVGEAVLEFTFRRTDDATQGGRPIG
jgi:hypothetical protein